MRRLVYQLRTEGGTPARDACAIGVGVFVGASPWYGFHLVLCWALGWLLRLNRLKMYLAANISNPLMAPLLILTELQAGAWVRRGSFHELTVAAVKNTDPWIFGADLLVGSVIVGGILGMCAGFATWMTTRRRGDDPLFEDLVAGASDRYVSASITAWEFARGKLRGDPVYRAVVFGGLLPSGGTLVDVGCGQGLALALLAEAAGMWRGGRWPADPPPLFDRLIGIELRPRVAAMARRALAADAEVIAADARVRMPASCRAALFFDVLHMMPARDQEAVLQCAATALDPGGCILVREADAAAGGRFRAVMAGNWLKAAFSGNWRQTFHYRTRAEWSGLFAASGFVVDVRGAGEGTPFGNVLFVLTRAPRASG